MKRCLTAALLLLTCHTSLAAVYDLPAGRKPAAGTWEAAGVPGGIPTNRTQFGTTIETTGDTTDRTAEIQGAINACPQNQYVELGAGTFVVNGLLLPQGRPNMTLRGGVDGAGNPTTLLDLRGGGVTLGTNYAPDWPPGGTPAVVAGLTKGATSIQVADSSFFGNGQFVLIALANENVTPVIHTYGFSRMRGQFCKIVDVGGVPDSTHIVIEAPGLHGDYTAVASAIVTTTQFKSTGQGLENIAVTTANRTGGAINFPILLDTAYGSWVKNCRVQETDAFGIYMDQTFRCEIRHNWIEPNAAGGSTSSGGMAIQSSSMTKIEDNVFEGNPFAILQERFNSGNVIAYNFLTSTGGNPLTPVAIINTNHNSFNQYTLVEGNLGMNYQCDGYYGGNQYDTIVRNWLMGSPLESMEPIFATSSNRFTRHSAFVGNVLGRTGISPAYGYVYSWGNPNLSNSGNNGRTAEPSTGSWWSEYDGDTGTTKYFGTLTTRTDDTHGIITLNPGIVFDEDARSSSAYPSLVISGTGFTWFVHYSDISVDGTEITIEQGPLVINLPVEGSAMEIWGSPSGFQELDLDVENTALLVSNYLAYIAGIPETEELPPGDTLPDSFMYESAPTFFVAAGFAWPPVDAMSPTENTYELVPAGYRYNHNADPPTGDPAPPVNTKAPTITGTTTQGQTLTGHNGSWTGNPSPTFTRKWRRCNASGASCSDISGATTTSYVLVIGDVGSTIRYQVTGTNTEGSDIGTSDQTEVIAPTGGSDPTPVISYFSGRQNVIIGRRR